MAQQGHKSLLGQRVAQLRRKQGWSQAELARRMGVHQTMICKIEQGERLQGIIDTLVQLAQALEVNPTDLLADPGESLNTEPAPTAA